MDLNILNDLYRRGTMKIGFVGAGNMGGAFIKALDSYEIYFTEKDMETVESIKKATGAEHTKNTKELIQKSDYIVLGVKPQVLDSLLDEFKSEDLSDKIIISLVAGIKIDFYRKKLGENIKFVRVMPNTPSLIKKGICGYTPYNIDEFEETYVNVILESTGKAIKVEEDKLDIITAISGSGPAYVFLLINSLADAGVKLGLSKKDALMLATETFVGSASLISETGLHPEELKDRVTSPGGTTACGLAVMEEYGVRSAMYKTVEATYQKAKELGKKEE
jgi:pyrroline-5-carboxylate reductase